MADEQDSSQKTEQPSQKRLDDARKKGDVVKSQDVPIWFLFLAAAGVMAGAGPLATMIATPLSHILDHPQSFHLADGGAQKLLYDVLMALAVPMAVVFSIMAVGAVLGHVIQGPPVWTTEKIKPDLSKLSPMKGFGRMFGAQAWVNLLKSFLKMSAVGVAVVYAIWPDRNLIVEAGQMSMQSLLAILQQMAGRLMLAAVVVVGVIAGLDWVWQRWSFMQRMKMSRQELRDEHKQAEGDPHIKAKLRAIRTERSRKRMLANVAKASVVINNPTHYSVALRYDPKIDAAPICLAKGVDDLALRIREKAKEHNVPMVENIALARALFATVEVDESIPREHFEAVAKVIGFVMNTARGRRQ